MIRWLRVLLPPVCVLVVYAVLYALMEGGLRFVEWRIGAGLIDVHVRPGTMLLVIGCMSYAWFRIGYFHPACNLPYRQWLRSTPWTSSKPLPLGPIALVWQDGLLLLVMALAACAQPDLDPLHLLTWFLMVYLGLLALTFWPTGQLVHGYCIAFGLGLVLRLWHEPWAAATTVALLYPVGYAGLRQSLTRFPWDLSRQEQIRRGLSGQGKGYLSGEADALGWPFERLRPKLLHGMQGIRTRDAILVSLLAGWWLYAVTSLFSDPALRAGIAQVANFMVVGFLAMSRFAVYFAGHKPPINLWGRLGTFRWVIPGYDQILLAPVAVILIGALFPVMGTMHGLKPEVAVPLSLSLALWAALGIGPSLLNWHLTGQHRLVPGLDIRQRCVKAG